MEKFNFNKNVSYAFEILLYKNTPTQTLFDFADQINHILIHIPGAWQAPLVSLTSSIAISLR